MITDIKYECFCILPTAEFRDGGQQGQNYANADLPPAPLQSDAGRHNAFPNQPSVPPVRPGKPVYRMPHHVESSVQYHDYAQGTGNLSRMAEYPSGYQVPSVSRPLQDKPTTSPHERLTAASQHSGNPYSNANPPGHDQTSDSHVQDTRYKFFWDADQHGHNYVDADLVPATLQSNVGRHNIMPFQSPEHHLQPGPPDRIDFAGNNQFPPDSTRTSSFPQGGSGKVQDSATSSSPVEVPASNCEPPFGQQEQSHQMTREVQQILKLEELNLSGTATKPSEVSMRGPNGQESSNLANLAHQLDDGSQNIPPSSQQGSVTAGTSYSEQVPRRQEKVPVERHISTDFSDAGSRCPQQKIPVEMSYATIKRYFQHNAKKLGRGGFGFVYEGKLMDIV